MSPATPKTSAKAPGSRLGSLGKDAARGGPKPSVVRQSGAGSLLQRPTEASVASSHGSVLGKKPQPRKELSFKQQLLKKTLKESELRPSGVLALHIKQGHFHDIDSGGMLSPRILAYVRTASFFAQFDPFITGVQKA